jgi:hypothetical protein
MTEETCKKQMRDSDIIFIAITSGDFVNFEKVQQTVEIKYLTDLSFSRAGIYHALKRLEKYYAEP